ncbi:MAG: site-specific integrase, partial [Glaciimonas sp.]|nr:site-specific integrase [Glaciimonas sp.]
SAMRLREMYTLTVDQVDLNKRTIFLDKTKNGDRRQVPLSSVAIDAIKEYMEHVKEGTNGMKGFTFDDGRLFLWWSGEADKKELQRVTSLLSRQFARIYEAASCDDLHFHDLRHEATSRLFEKTNLSDLEIAKITGHRTPAMLMRYANLRGSNLASRLW